MLEQLRGVHRKLARSARAVVEHLEIRSLLSVSIDSSGTLIVTGTSAADNISVVEFTNIDTATPISVTFNGATTSYNRTGVNLIVVNAGDGNDVLRSTTYGIPIILNGQGGNDDMRNDGSYAFDVSYLTNRTTLNGGAGDDLVLDYDYGGGAGVLHGDEGNDQIEVNNDQGGHKELYGDGGNDTLVPHPDGPDFVSGGDGIDLLDYYNFGTVTSVSLDGLWNDKLSDGFALDNIQADVENVSFSCESANPVTVIGSAAANHFNIHSQAGARINGLGGDDLIEIASSYGSTVHGNAGNDTILAGSGNDFLYGDEGNDFIQPGLGNDLVSGGSWGSDTVDYSERTGNLVVKIAQGPISGETGEKDNIMDDIENVHGGSGNDLIIGSIYNNVLVGNAGNDTIKGSNGDDVLVGGAGADKLYGENGNDTLFAKDGFTTDFCDGGGGTDKVQRDKFGSVSDLLFSCEILI